MGIQDDIFDVRHALRRNPSAKDAFERIETYLARIEGDLGVATTVIGGMEKTFATYAQWRERQGATEPDPEVAPEPAIPDEVAESIRAGASPSGPSGTGVV